MINMRLLICLPGIIVMAGAGVAGPDADRLAAMRAAIHPVDDVETMNAWLSRVPVTRDFPDDLATTLGIQTSGWIVEMTSGPACVPCGDLWSKLDRLGRTYGWQLATISQQEALMRSGRLGLRWVGHPVGWVRSRSDPQRIVPIAIGTDHKANLVRNIYLAVKMLEGVRPAVGVRALSKFTGIVGMPVPLSGKR